MAFLGGYFVLEIADLYATDVVLLTLVECVDGAVYPGHEWLDSVTTEFALLYPSSIWMVLAGGGFGLFRVVDLWLDTKELGGFLWIGAGLDCLSMGGFCLVLTGGWVVNWVVDFVAG